MPNILVRILLPIKTKHERQCQSETRRKWPFSFRVPSDNQNTAISLDVGGTKANGPSFSGLLQLLEECIGCIESDIGQ